MKRYLFAAQYSLLIMLICSLIFIFNRLFALHLNHWGIVPRSTAHLSGILISPFLHASWGHLLSNFFPFIVLGMLVGLQGVQRFLLLFLFFVVSTGSLVWLFARGNSIHIGMSGVVYALWGYLLVYGFVCRQILPLFISLFTLFFYGGLVFGVFPGNVSISFESHLMGALVGGVTGYYLAKRSLQY
ncbi:MAG: rhomboid family intramembrane serine protease [Psychromonas sp.]|nr:rhomboid family intramembrane serine protease [Psychromonas sp.]